MPINRTTMKIAPPSTTSVIMSSPPLILPRRCTLNGRTTLEPIERKPFDASSLMSRPHVPTRRSADVPLLTSLCNQGNGGKCKDE